LGQTYNIEKLSRVAISPAWNLFEYIEDTRDPISFLATEKFAREIAPRPVKQERDSLLRAVKDVAKTAKKFGDHSNGQKYWLYF
jgi:hypothetical protein